MRDCQSAATRRRKPRFRRDHWWDSTAQMLVAQSIEHWFRENLKPRTRSAATREYRLPDYHDGGDLGDR
jgi:hypothetical protein